MIGNGAEPTTMATSRSSSVCPAASRAAAAAFNAANSCSSCAEPTCSIERDPRRDHHTICTAVAPGAVVKMRTQATTAAYDQRLVRNPAAKSDKTAGPATLTPLTTHM